MKKLLILLLAITLLPMGVFATGNTFQPSGTDNQEFKVDITPVSTFAVTKSSNSSVDQVGKKKIASLLVSNNTRDGYTISITPTSGKLVPAGTDNGEEAMSYDLAFESLSGTLGGGMSIIGAKQAENIAGGTAINIVELDGSKQTSKTESLDIKCSMVLAKGLENQLSLAGTYTETFTYLYTDH